MANSLSCVTHVKSLLRHKTAGSTQPELWLRPHRTGGSAAQEYLTQAYSLVFEYIETFYKTARTHSHCDYTSPNDFEKLYIHISHKGIQQKSS